MRQANAARIPSLPRNGAQLTPRAREPPSLRSRWKGALEDESRASRTTMCHSAANADLSHATRAGCAAYEHTIVTRGPTKVDIRPYFNRHTQPNTAVKEPKTG